MDQYKFSVTRDSVNRLDAPICEGIVASVKLIDLPPSFRSSGSQGTFAYVILKVRTALGTLLGRDIHIRRNRATKEFFLRYRQFKTGRQNNNEDEYLDIFGPWDQSTRNRLQNVIIELFEELLDRENNGDLPPEISKRRTAPSHSRSVNQTSPPREHSDESGASPMKDAARVTRE